MLEVALRDAHSSLERLNALLVLVCDIKERHHLLSAVVDGFELFRLPPFTPNDVMALVQQRLASVGVMDSAFTMKMLWPSSMNAMGILRRSYPFFVMQ